MKLSSRTAVRPGSGSSGSMGFLRATRRFLADRWRRIGARLYLALGIAVALTLISAAVGVYYFEQSGDLNHQVRSESVPALEASWTAARETERLRNLGLGVVAESESGFQSLDGDAVGESLSTLQAALNEVKAVPVLDANAEAVNVAAQDLADIIDGLVFDRSRLLAANENAANHRASLAATSSGFGESEAISSALRQMLQASDEAVLLQLWEEDFSVAYTSGSTQSEATLQQARDIFNVRIEQLDLEARIRDSAVSFDEASATLETAISSLLVAARAHSSDTIELAVSSFDEGRTLLTGISVISVIIATLAAWIWVGNGMVRRLSRMSDRMRDMAHGDLETPVPEVGRDEIGELAGALEVFRQQALEVQRLNLVEKLYTELQETNAELQRVQARLVAQEKLAALGELVSGVAHEISNPLNFVNNFSEGSLELYNELSEMLDHYRDRMSEEDTALLDDISQEMTNSLRRVLSNGGRALAIVERMRSFGVAGGDPVMSDLNSDVRDAVQAGCNTFSAEWDDFSVQPAFNLDESIGEVLLVEHDFGEAMLNLVSNACYAMWQKGQEAADNYQPHLTVSTRLVEGNVEIKVRDNGPGIADDVISHIFNPFFSTREGALGAGLGLPFAADVVRRLGGDLSVDTVHGEYAEFTITLPATAPTTITTSIPFRQETD